MAKYLVTGGAGFIGSHIVDALVKNKQKVRVLDNFVTGKVDNLKDSLGKIELIKGDIRNKKIVEKTVKGCDFILHQAALRSVPKSLENPREYNEVNINGTLNILEAAVKFKVKRVVFASSSSVYGESNIFPEKESHTLLLISPYALTKLGGEYYCRIFTKIYKLETVGLRYFNVFGPRQSLESQYAVVIPKVITCMLRKESPPVHGDGRQSRDFTYISNIVNANILACNAKRVSGLVFNIASGKDYSILSLVNYLNKILGADIKPRFTPPRTGDVRRTLADISLAKKLLGFKITTDFQKGLKITLDWFKNEYK